MANATEVIYLKQEINRLLNKTKGLILIMVKLNWSRRKESLLELIITLSFWWLLLRKVRYKLMICIQDSLFIIIPTLNLLSLILKLQISSSSQARQDFGSLHAVWKAECASSPSLKYHKVEIICNSKDAIHHILVMLLA